MSEEEVEELETLQYSLMSSPGLQISIKADEANVLAKKGEQEWRPREYCNVSNSS